MTERAFNYGRGLLEGGDHDLAARWRALPIWQQWAFANVADGITLQMRMTDEGPRRAFSVGAKRESDGDTWRSVIRARVLEDTHDVFFAIASALRGIREDFLLPEAEHDAAALRRLRAMASSIVPNETPAYTWLKWQETDAD
jgi:hypothetical protein